MGRDAYPIVLDAKNIILSMQIEPAIHYLQLGARYYGILYMYLPGICFMNFFAMASAS